MSTKKLNERLFENWPQKIICIILSIVLYVFNRVSSLERKVFTVPLKVEASGLMMPASEVPRFVKVTIRTKAENMPGISSSSVFASVNLDEYTETGRYRVPISISLSEGLILLDPLEYSAKPDSIEIDLDTKALAYIPVKAALSGEVEHGYTISNVEINPSTVKVVGPSKMIEKTKFISTRKVIVSNAAKNFTQEVKLDNINSKVMVMPESDFKVTVTVVPATDSKDFKDIIPSVLNLSETLSVESQIPAVSFKLAGTVPALERFSVEQDTVSLDFSSVTEPGTYEIPVNIAYPRTMALSEKTAETVTVTVVERDVYENAEEMQQASEETLQDAEKMQPETETGE